MDPKPREVAPIPRDSALLIGSRPDIAFFLVSPGPFYNLTWWSLLVYPPVVPD